MLTMLALLAVRNVAMKGLRTTSAIVWCPVVTSTRWGLWPGPSPLLVRGEQQNKGRLVLAGVRHRRTSNHMPLLAIFKRRYSVLGVLSRLARLTTLRQLSRVTGLTEGGRWLSVHALLRGLAVLQGSAAVPTRLTHRDQNPWGP